MRFTLIASAVSSAELSHKTHNHRRHCLSYFICYLQNMDSHEAAFDCLAAEKAKAMRKYRHHQNFKSVLTACAAVSPLFFALSRYLPSASKLSGDIFRQAHAVFDNQLYVFSLVMVLLAAIYALARQQDEESSRSPDIYEEFAVNRVYCPSVVVNGGDKGGVCSETEKTPPFPKTESKADEEPKNAVVLFPPIDGRETVTETESRYVPPVRAISMESADVALVEKEKRYMRTQSESFEKKISSTTRVMRRSETEIYRKTKSCCGEEAARRLGSVEVLDDEEFNRKIQEFIVKNKMKQKKEYESERVERERERRMKEEEDEERRRTEAFNCKIKKFIEDMKQIQKEEKRQEEEDERRRRRKTEGNYVRMASFTSAVIH